MFREAAFGGQYVQEAMNSTVHHGTCGRALSSLVTIVVPNGQQRWFLTPSEESAASDTRSSLLWALRARHCYLTFSVTVATAILNVAILKKCWQSTWLTKLLCRKSALRTRHCYSESAWEWRIFRSRVKLNGADILPLLSQKCMLGIVTEATPRAKMTLSLLLLLLLMPTLIDAGEFL